MRVRIVHHARGNNAGLSPVHWPQTFEHQEIVVTANKAKADQAVGGMTVPETPKARQSLTQEFIEHQVPGQSIDDIINYIPGVSFQNNDPYGIDGGTLSIHGFAGQFVSQTFDGIPQNDSGNYALYPQDQVDPELIERVDVTLGSTDIDSPTASATGSTVNYITRKPTDDFHARVETSMGQWDFMRIFGVVDTGDLTTSGTRMWLAGSFKGSSDPYNSLAKQTKDQFNAKIYQPLGNNGDFISLAGWFDRDRGNRFNDAFLQTTSGGLPASSSLVPSEVPPCTINPANPSTTKAIAKNSCGSTYGLGYRPSDNANIRENARVTLAQGLILTVDASYNYTKANSNGGVAGQEGFYKLGSGATAQSIYGYIGGTPYLGGIPVYGDAAAINPVELGESSTTVTNRYVVITNLIYKITPTQTVRLNYTLDHAKLRQTGEVGLLQENGMPAEVYPSDNPLLDASGMPIEGRNRTSFSILNQVAGEYRGQFLDNKLVVTGGVRAPFFKRDLTNYCVSESGGNGYVDCFNNPAFQAAFLAANPTYQSPQSRNYNYNAVLPSAGFTYNVTRAGSVFFDYSQGISVPSTDDLYDTFAYSTSSPLANVQPQRTYNFEGGLRYKTRKIQAQISGWYTVLHNAIADSYASNPEAPTQFITLFSDIGTVHRYGLDASVAYQPIPQLTLYAFGSYLHSRILDNTQTSTCNANNVKFKDPSGLGPCATVGQPVYALTGGAQEAGIPRFMVGGRAQGNFGPVSIGIQAKYTGSRFANDQDLPFVSRSSSGDGLSTDPLLFPAKVPSYTLVDLDARVKLGFLGLNDKTYLQLNVHNLFDKFYVGGFSGSTLSNTFTPFVYIGTPRTISGTVNVAF